MRCRTRRVRAGTSRGRIAHGRAYGRLSALARIAFALASPTLRPLQYLPCPSTDSQALPLTLSFSSPSILAAKDLRFAHPSPADVTSTRRLESCCSTSHTTRTQPPKSDPCSGPYFFRVCIFLYMGSSFIRSFFFRARPHAVFASFAPSTLTFCRQTSSHPFDPAPPVMPFDAIH